MAKRAKLSQDEELSDNQLYEKLSKYVMTERQLNDYGYPKPHPTKSGSAILPNQGSYKTSNNYDTNVRTCSRCQKTYTVDGSEMPTKKEVCFYHFKRPFNQRYGGQKYPCCMRGISSRGCSSNDYHIVEGFDRPDYCDNYVRTQPLEAQTQTKTEHVFYGIYSVDTEMCNTTYGRELTRVTVVNAKQESIYETMVKPKNSVLDYNTRSSGLKESDLEGVTTTLSDVQTKLLSLFNDKTILIGHSLESDLKAMKIIHNTVIDTAQVFPHNKGLPFKKNLKQIAKEFLQENIQDHVKGHDSLEDAIAALKLMLCKIGTDFKKFKR